MHPLARHLVASRPQVADPRRVLQADLGQLLVRARAGTQQLEDLRTLPRQTRPVLRGDVRIARLRQERLAETVKQTLLHQCVGPFSHNNYCNSLVRSATQRPATTWMLLAHSSSSVAILFHEPHCLRAKRAVRILGIPFSFNARNFPNQWKRILFRTHPDVFDDPVL